MAAYGNRHMNFGCMLIRKTFIRCIMPLLLLCMQWCYGQDSAGNGSIHAGAGYADSAATNEENANNITGAADTVTNASDTISNAIEHLYKPALRQVPDSLAARLRAQKDFEYANDPAYWRKEIREPSSSGFWYYLSRFFLYPASRVIFYVLVVGILLYALYRVVLVNKLFIFYPSSKAGKGGEEGAEQMSEENIDEQLGQAINQKDYRNAVRCLYLRVLRGLHAKGYITWHAQATNDDYARQMRNHPSGTEFAFLTRVYDYVWYGGLEINEAQFGSVYNNFQNFYKNTTA